MPPPSRAAPSPLPYWSEAHGGAWITDIRLDVRKQPQRLSSHSSNLSPSNGIITNVNANVNRSIANRSSRRSHLRMLTNLTAVLSVPIQTIRTAPLERSAVGIEFTSNY
ncbi:hypothetical protein FRC20_011680 [Serendipita sp. 405]|nr:hypothetical protein FRC15_008618 [Serendipita sp. 397]KAG8860212.1 hypothetical protein FRC20_011680 [Serendipita sp. 405]